MEVHCTSGVYNKAFCLVAKTSGWDVKKAFQAFALANKSYWTATSTFNSGTFCVELAATDMGYSSANVVSAITGVGVTCPGTGGGTTALSNGVALTGQAVATGADLNYTVAVPPGASNLAITISGGTGDADLYPKFGSAPTLTSYGCRPYLTGNNESCSVASPSAGTYFVKLHGFSACSGLTIKVRWSTSAGGGNRGLQNGVPITGPSGSTGTKLQYTVTVPAGSSLSITTSGGTGDEDLYVRRVPTRPPAATTAART